MQTISDRKLYNVIGASSLGTLIEWYDFYIFGSLATIISEKFFPPGNPTAAFLATLATFAAGFIVRPFGALVFGRLGDLIGRKYTFLLTLTLMGGSTFCIQTTATLGLLVSLIVIITCQQTLSKDDYNNWGWRLPFLLSIVLVIISIIIRMRMQESPLFAQLKEEGKTSVNPLKES